MRRTPIAATDIQVSKRLLEWRLRAGYTRVSIAHKILTSVERLASYELGRAPLSYSVALKIWDRYNLSLRWLATGKGDELCNPTENAAINHLGMDSGRYVAFSEGYVAQLAPILDRENKRIATEEDALILFAQETPLRLAEAGVDPAGVEAFNSAAIKLRVDIERLREKSAVAMSSQMVTINGVLSHAPQLPALLDRVRAATTQRGAQAALADYLGVPRQHLNRWLSGLAEPGGETTLRLLKWVSEAEASQKKDADRVAARPAQKTRTKPTRESKQSKGPPKK